MRIAIDTGKCIGSGLCALSFPTLFTQDEDGFGAVITGRAAEENDPRASQAARACPVQAISLSSTTGARDTVISGPEQ